MAVVVAGHEFLDLANSALGSQGVKKPKIITKPRNLLALALGNKLHIQPAEHPFVRADNARLLFRLTH